MSDLEELLRGGDRLYAPIEMAHIVGYKRETIQLMCRQGQIEAHKMGSQWRISKAEISRFIKEGPMPIGHFKNEDAEKTS